MKSMLCGFAGCLLLLSLATPPLRAQGSAAPAQPDHAQQQPDPLAGLSPENRELFDALRDAIRQGRDADVLTYGRKLLAALPPDAPLVEMVTHITAVSALETGDAAYALTLIKPIAAAHPDNWQAAALLARTYAETGDKTLRDQQIARVIDLHKQTSDPNFSKLHIFPIQKVKLNSGYAVFLYPFEPLKPYNTYLVALIYASDGKQDYRMELGSEDADQAFFKPKHPGERRFSIDTYREVESNGKTSESQSLHGFIDGVFDYDTMRDKMVAVANGEKGPGK